MESTISDNAWKNAVWVTKLRIDKVLQIATLYEWDLGSAIHHLHLAEDALRQLHSMIQCEIVDQTLLYEKETNERWKSWPNADKNGVFMDEA